MDCNLCDMTIRFLIRAQKYNFTCNHSHKKLNIEGKIRKITEKDDFFPEKIAEPKKNTIFAPLLRA